MQDRITESWEGIQDKETESRRRRGNQRPKCEEQEFNAKIKNGAAA
jgi:hypothetical protein